MIIQPPKNSLGFQKIYLWSKVIIFYFSFFLFLSLNSIFSSAMGISEEKNLLIVEVQIAGEKADHDFIKIYNPSDTEIDVSGYKLRKRSSRGGESSIRVFPKGSKIKAKGYFLWANSKDDFHVILKADVWSKSVLVKNNSVALLNPEGAIIDALAWGESQNPFVRGKAFSENPVPNQQLKRKKAEEGYQNTNDNSRDFYLFPPKQFLEKEKISNLGPASSLEGDFLSESEKNSREKTKETTKIDINTASLKDLIKIVHLGEKGAEELISLRPFYSLDDLRKIRGISQKNLEDIKKQGLAWVDPNLKLSQPKETQSVENDLSVSALSLSPNKTSKSILIFLLAISISIFSGLIILILKKNYKD